MSWSSPEEELRAVVLAGVPQEAQHVIWTRLLDLTEGLVEYWSETPPGRRGAVKPVLQHMGHAPFRPEALRQQVEHLLRLLGIEARLTVEAAEAFVLGPDHEDALLRLRVQCVRLGQLYTAIERQTWTWLAKALLDWQLYLLRYRASPACAALLWGEAVVPPGALGAGG